jgi:hypothetical protein
MKTPHLVGSLFAHPIHKPLLRLRVSQKLLKAASKSLNAIFDRMASAGLFG